MKDGMGLCRTPYRRPLGTEGGEGGISPNAPGGGGLGGADSMANEAAKGGHDGEPGRGYEGKDVGKRDCGEAPRQPPHATGVEGVTEWGLHCDCFTISNPSQKAVTTSASLAMHCLQPGVVSTRRWVQMYRTALFLSSCRECRCAVAKMRHTLLSDSNSGNTSKHCSFRRDSS